MAQHHFYQFWTKYLLKMNMLNQFINSMIMKMKATKFSLFGLLALFLVFTACEDDFSERDLLELQAELAETKAQSDFDRQLLLLAQELANDIALAQANDDIQRAYQEFLASLDSAQDESRRQRALALLTQAGLITDYTVNMTSSDMLVEGGVVSITNGTGTVSDTTDAQGQVTFTNVPVGRSIISVSAADHLGFSYIMDFGSAVSNLQSIVIDGTTTTVVEPNIAESTVRMINTNAGDKVATIKGTVTGEVDLTNDEPEALAGVPVKASLQNNLGNAYNGTTGSFGENNLITFTAANNAGSVRDIYFNEDSGFGVDTTAADGTYTIVVPADRDLDLDYDLVFPETLSGTQTLAAVANDSASIVEIATTWGVGISPTSAPNVYGYQFEISTPGDLGSGFAVGDVAAVGRSITEVSSAADWESFFTSATIGERTDIDGGLDDIGTVNVRGQQNDFTATPTVTVNGNGTGDNDARIDAELTWDFGTVTLTASDAGRYSDGASFDLHLNVIGYFQGSTSDVDTIRFTFDGVTASNPGGEVAAATFDLDGGAYGFETVFYSNDAGGFDNQGFFEDLGSANIERDHDFYVTSVGVELELTAGTDNATGAAAAVSIAGANGDGLTWDVEDGGEGYDAAPTFGFSGFSPAPNWVIHEFATRYQFNISSGGTDYTFVPDDIDMEYRNFTNDENTTGTATIGNVTSYMADSTSLSSKAFADHLTVNSGAFEAQNDSAAYFVTDWYLNGAPSLVELEAGDAIELGYIQFNGDNGVSRFDVTVGSGYTSIPSISYVARSLAANSSGLDISPDEAADFSDVLGSVETDERSKQITWSLGNPGNYINIYPNTQGSGFTYNLNDTGSSSISDADARWSYTDLNPGETRVNQDIDYGYGMRETEPEGDESYLVVYFN
jgi:hypothetical protein